jgi:hypothetical protein
MREIAIVCVLVLGALSAPPVFAEEVQKIEKTITTTSTTTSSGTVSQFGPDAIVIKSSSSSTPVAYQYTTATTYVDEMDRPFAMKNVKPGMPVTVHYAKAGDVMVATKIVVKKVGDSDDDDDD